MKLLRLEIQDFGAFHDFSLDLADGLNTVCRENGWGKSTLAVFIKAMLYGLPATRKTDLDFNERKKYQPWGGGTFGGSLEFECATGRFRVERTFGAREAKDEFRLFDLATGKPSDAFGSDIGSTLFGIDADGFERSAYLSERALDTEGENASVRAKLTGLVESPDDMGCYDEAQAAIDKRRKYYEVKGGRGYISDLDSELRNRTRRLEELREKQTEQAAAAEALRRAEKEVAAAEASLNRFHSSQLSAERANAVRRQYEELQSDLRAKERRLQEIVHAFGDGAVPTEGEIGMNRTRLAEFRSIQLTAQAAVLSEDEQSRLSALTRRFPKGIPTAADFDRADASERDLRDAELRLARIAAPEVPPAVLRVRQVGLPAEEALSRAAAAIDRADRLAVTESVRGKAPVRRRIPLPVPLLTLLCGIGLLILPLIPEAGLQGLPLFLGGGTLLLASLILFLAGGKPKQPAAEEHRETPESVLEPVRSMLTRYGLHRQGGNLREELTQLSLLSAQARAADASERQSARERAALTSKQTGAKTELTRFFTAFGLPYPSGDLPRALAGLRSDANELTALRRRAETLQARRTESETGLSQKQAAIRSFFDRLTAVHAGKQPEDCQMQIERLCMEHRQLTAEIAALTGRKDAFYRENRAVLDAPAPAVGSDADLRGALRAAREQAQKQRETWSRLTDQTADIPELTDRISRLQEELDTARANLSVLRNAAEYLEKAKEALSTRYMGGIQSAFQKRLDRLGKATGLQAVMDSQLTVSVRDGGATRAITTASRGTRDLLRFCARLALTEALTADGEKPFLLLDDPFVNFDDAHLRAALAYLRDVGKDTQILYFVCHPSRAGQQKRSPS